MTLHTTFFSINPDATYTLIGEEAIIIGADENQLFSTNPVGATILQLLETTALTIPMLQNHLLEHFEIDAAQCLSDTEQFISSLLKEKLIIPFANV